MDRGDPHACRAILHTLHRVPLHCTLRSTTLFTLHCVVWVSICLLSHITPSPQTTALTVKASLVARFLSKESCVLFFLRNYNTSGPYLLCFCFVFPCNPTKKCWGVNIARGPSSLAIISWLLKIWPELSSDYYCEMAPLPRPGLPARALISQSFT